MSDQKKKFAKVYNKYIEKIYRFVFLKVGSRETAEDLTSQVFTKGWQRVRTKQDIENLPAYLYQIARTEIADYFRDQDRFRTISTETGQIVDNQPNPEESQKVQSDIETIKGFLGQLSEDYQNVILWRYVDNYSIKEIANIMEKSEGAVRVMIHRGLKELREKMENEGKNKGNL